MPLATTSIKINNIDNILTIEIKESRVVGDQTYLMDLYKIQKPYDLNEMVQKFKNFIEKSELKRESLIKEYEDRISNLNFTIKQLRNENQILKNNNMKNMNNNMMMNMNYNNNNMMNMNNNNNMMNMNNNMGNMNNNIMMNMMNMMMMRNMMNNMNNMNNFK